MVSQNIYTWVYNETTGANSFKKQKIRTPLGPCTDGRLGFEQGSKDYLGVMKNYKCPQSNFTYDIHGSFAGETTKFIEIAVRECNQTMLNLKYNNTKQCVDTSEMLRVTQNLKLWLIVQNTNFDVNDFSDNPIHKSNKPYYLTSFANKSVYYYMQVSQNDVIMQDNMIYGSSNYASFVETKVNYDVM